MILENTYLEKDPNTSEGGLNPTIPLLEVI